MIPHDILTLYSVKTIEYLISVGFLLLFVPFWRFVNTEVVGATALAPTRRPAAVESLVEWFTVARDAAIHPGHAWAHAEPSGIVRVGLDDVAQKLVGPIAALELPEVGAELRQGDPAWRLRVDGTAIDMVAPVDGRVVAVNTRAVEEPALVNNDPFGAGWLLTVDAPRFTANRRSLLSGRLAERWVEEITNALRLRLSPELGLLVQDGGTPVAGLARAIDPERWDMVAREFLLTADTTDAGPRPGAIELR